MNKQETKSLVYKSNSLVEAKYRLTVTEQKILLFLISKVDPTKPDFNNPYSVKFDDVAQQLGLERGGTQYAQVHSAVEKLMSRLVKIYEKDEEDQEVENTISWFYRRRYVCGSDSFQLWFHEDLRKYVLQLSNFLKYNYSNIYQIRSSYAIRLYELLKQWEKKGGKTFSLEFLRDRLGIRETEYKKYNDFKKRIILHSAKELEENTDICFDFDEIKVCRRVTEIIFYIKKNDPSGTKTPKKRGRPPKKKPVHQGPSIGELLDAAPHWLEKYGVRNPERYYSEEGLTDEDFKVAIEQLSQGNIGADLDTGHIIVKARDNQVKRRNAEISNGEDRKTIERIAANKAIAGMLKGAYKEIATVDDQKVSLKLKDEDGRLLHPSLYFKDYEGNGLKDALMELINKSAQAESRQGERRGLKKSYISGSSLRPRGEDRRKGEAE